MEAGRRTGPRRASAAVRLLSAMAVLAVAGTYLAAQIDFLRRHTLGFPPLDVRRYWVLQIKFIWVRGLAAALLLALAAYLLHRRDAENHQQDSGRIPGPPDEGATPGPPPEGRLASE
jgi:hypothetical protein